MMNGGVLGVCFVVWGAVWGGERERGDGSRRCLHEGFGRGREGR